MTPAEASTVLMCCAAFDGRKPDQATPLAWADVLDPAMQVQDALAIVKNHYANSREWIMPADLNHAFSELRQKRVSEFRQHHPEVFIPDGLGEEPAVELEWRKAFTYAISAGAGVQTATAHAWQTIDRTPPTLEPQEQRKLILEEIGRKPPSISPCLLKPLNAETIGQS